MSQLWKSFLWALAACLVSMGTALTSYYTLSARVSAPEVTRMDECLLGGKSWDCVDRHSSTTAIDPGAISWQEIPINIFFNKYKFESKPLWNPYIGSGYPVFLDGIYRNLSAIRQWLVFFPSDQGRDFAIFFRFLVWTWGILYAVSLLVTSNSYLFFVGLAATMLSYVQKYLDIIFLDVEMAIPWIFALFILLSRNISRAKVFTFFAILSLWVGSQSFIQSQVVFCMVFALLGIGFYFKVGNKVLAPVIIFSLGFCASGFLNILEFKSFFAELVSNRSFVGCVSNHNLPWSEIWFNSYIGLVKRAEINTFFTVLALPVVFFGAAVNKEIRTLLFFYLILLLWIIRGSPTILCQFTGLNAIHFWRHLVPYLQSLFLILSASSLYILAERVKLKNLFLNLGFILTIIPASNRTMISIEHISGKFPKENSFVFEEIPANNIYSKVQALSEQEDRRHFSPDFRLYPNYSSAFNILDMRVLYGSYPKRIFALNDGLFNGWHEMPFYKHADRFIGFDKSITEIPADFEKLMLLHRVSMISFSKSNNWIKNSKIYNGDKCHLLQEDQLAQLYLCSFVGGVGFFPNKVIVSRSQEESLESLKQLDAMDTLDFAVIESHLGESRAAKGTVVKVMRKKDAVIYELKVSSPGYFVYADTYFPGWKAKINGTETEIFPANVGFKSVWVPEGDLTLEWSFSKGGVH